MTEKLIEIQDRLTAAKKAFCRAVLARDYRAISCAVVLCDAIEAEEKAEIEEIRRRVGKEVDRE